MAIAMNFPKSLENPIEKISMVLTKSNDDAERDGIMLAKYFKMKGSLKDKGALYEIRDNDQVLHRFTASDSMRWEDMKALSCGVDAHLLNVKDEKKLLNIAIDFLKEKGLADNDAVFSHISYGTASTVTPQTTEDPESVVVCAYVNFTFQIDGVPVLGPGAKMRVVVGEGGRVIGCYKFWRKPVVQDEVRPLIDYSLAQRYFQASPLFAKMKSPAVADIKRVRAGYLSMGPRHTQGALIPVYEITGSVPTAWNEPSTFTRHLIAIDFSNDDLKRHAVAGVHLINGGCNLM